jgi:hypothetical protein
VDYSRADAVLVGPMSGVRDRLVAFVADLLGRQPAEVGGVQLWTGVSRPVPAPAARGTRP